MSKATFNSNTVIAEFKRGDTAPDMSKDNRNVLPKSPKVRQILNDYWADENDRRKAKPDLR